MLPGYYNKHSVRSGPEKSYFHKRNIHLQAASGFFIVLSKCNVFFKLMFKVLIRITFENTEVNIQKKFSPHHKAKIV